MITRLRIATAWSAAALVLASLLALALGAPPAAASGPGQFPGVQQAGAAPTVPYQGQLTGADGRPAADGSYDLNFALFTAARAGSELWHELQPAVPVRSGLVAVTLGSLTPLPPDLDARAGLWLAVAVRGPQESAFTELAPRQPFVPPGQAGAASAAAASACPHTHVGESWNAAISWSSGAFKVNNSANGPSIWGVNSGGGNGLRGDGYGGALGVYGESDTGAGVVGRSASYRGVEGIGGKIGVRGEGLGSASGVYGTSPSGAGVYGHSDTQVGVFGEGALFGVYSSGNLRIDGSLYATGSKSGYVVEIAQNDDVAPLVRGDVVAISGAAPPVLGEIPVLKVRRTAAAGAGGVAGVVDETLQMVPSADRIDPAPVAASAAPADYLTVVTLGAFRAIKVDAGYGAVAPGDLLVSSPTPGYAMRSAAPAPGTVIGKALGALAAGQGEIPVLVTLQ